MQQPQQSEHCQDAEQLPAELPVLCPGQVPLADQLLSPIPHSMEQQCDSEGADTQGNLPPPSPSAATTHSAAAGLVGEQAATGSDVSLLPEVSTGQQPEQQHEEAMATSRVKGGLSGPSLDVPIYDGPLEDRALSSGRLMGETVIVVRALDNGDAIIGRPWLPPTTLQAIRSTVPGARYVTPAEIDRIPSGMDILFQSFPRREPKPEVVSVNALTEATDDEDQKKNTDRTESKSEGKQKAKETDEAAPPIDQASSSTSTSPAEKPPPEIHVAWEKHPERPLQKLPIRFHDAVGRNFIWPWNKAKKWKTAKSLIESAFMHVDILGPHVLEGHYDLVIRGAFVDNDSARVSHRLSSFPLQPPQQPPPPPPPPATIPEKVELTTSITTMAVIAPEGYHADKDDPTPPTTDDHPSSSAKQELDVIPSGPPPMKEANTDPVVPDLPIDSPPILGKVSGTGGRGALLLPELWEDFIEPGMVISMHMWPMVPSELRPPPPFRPPVGPVNIVGMGRGHRPGYRPGGPPPMMPGMRPMPPPLVITPSKPPKGKTRKRQDGL